MIPNRIIVTYISKAALNPLMKMCVQKMSDLHPDWEIVFFSDGDCEEFVRQQGPGFLELYRWYPRPVMRADFFGYWRCMCWEGFIWMRISCYLLRLIP